MRISISETFAKRIFQTMMLVVLGMCLVSFILRFYGPILSHRVRPETWGFNVADWVGMVDVDKEASIPQWLSASVLLLCSVLLAAIVSEMRKVDTGKIFGWGVLLIVFVFLSLDETVSVHEKLIEPLRSSLDTGGPFYFAWVIPGWLLVMILGLTYSRFLFDLPAKIRRLFIAAGSVYILGALVMEMLSGAQMDLHGEWNLTYVAIATTEEFLEMTGAVLFLYALMVYVSVRDTERLDEAAVGTNVVSRVRRES